jgi:hypothetical protein
MKKMSIIFLWMLTCFHVTQPVVKGSDVSVETLDFFTFPVNQSDNRLANYGWAQAGFALENSSTNAIFDSVFPVSGTLQLNGGTLTLNRDLTFNNTTTIQGLGIVIGNNHMLSMSQSCTVLPANTQKFQDTKIFLNNNVSLSSPVTFSGACLIKGNGHRLILGLNGSIIANGTLLLQDVIIQGVSGTNVRCSTPGSLLILDNSTWIQTANCSFSTGAFQCRNEVNFKGDGKILAYRTNQTSVIGSNSSVLFDSGFTFSYDPASSSASLLSFVDKSSQLILHNSLLHTSTVGIKLTKGSLFVCGDSAFASATRQVGETLVDNGITFGDGVSATNDFAGNVSAGSRLRVNQGSLHYKNLNASSWRMENNVSQLYMNQQTRLNLYNSLNLRDGVGIFGSNAVLARVNQAQFIGSVNALGNLIFEQL